MRAGVLQGPLPPAARGVPGLSGPADPALAGAVERALGDDGDLPPVRDLLAAAAAARPATGWEMARAVDAVVPGALEEREGGLYALLAELEREGAVAGSWTPCPDGRPRRLYRVPGRTPVDAAGGWPLPAPPALPLDAGARALLLRAARESSRAIPGPFERESARAEILSHLEDAAAAGAAAGLPPAEAARAALRDFGDPWKVRTDLGRVHRGRTVVVYPRTFGEWIRSWAIYDVVPLTVVLAVLLLVRWQVVQAYNIPTKSMEPTLHGEADDPDYIVVDKTAYLRREPVRFEPAVFYPPPGAARLAEGEDPTAFVKRCVGLPGDMLDILGGDIHVDGRLARRDPAVEDAMMVPLYDLPRDLRDTRSRARMRDPAWVLFDESWQSKTGTWSLRRAELRGLPGDEGEARLSFLKDLQNTYDEPDGGAGSVHQVAPAGDLEVRFVATAGMPGAVAGADLTEGTGDGQERHRVRLGPGGLTVASGASTWSVPAARLNVGIPVEVRFRNVDDRLTAWVDGEMVLRADLPPRASTPAEPAAGGVDLVVEGGPVSFGSVRILRDIVYLREKNSGWPRRIPEKTLFMMGDNTGNSHDSRAWGPVDRDSLIGRPFAIVYPVSRARILR